MAEEKYCGKCGRKYTIFTKPMQLGQGWPLYDQGTGEKYMVTYHVCPKIVNKWFWFGHTWVAYNKNGEIIPWY